MGTATAYDGWGCRCADAAEAHRIKRKRRTHGIPTSPHEGAEGNRWGYDVPGLGVNRRLQALAAIGWSQRALAEHLGVDRTWVGHLRSAKRVTVSTHLLVDRVYRELSTTPGGDTRAATWARKLGFPPPLAWDDNIDDPDAVPQHDLPDTGAGEGEAYEAWLISHLASSAEATAPKGLLSGQGVDHDLRRRVVAALTAAGRSAAEIGRQIGLTERHVSKIRTEAGCGQSQPAGLARAAEAAQAVAA